MPQRQRDVTAAFVARVKVAAKVGPDKFAKLLRVVATELGYQLVIRTPVDTGWARANWFATLSDDQNSQHPGLGAQPTRGDTSQAGRLAAEAQAMMQLVVQGFTPGQILSYVNNVAYIERLNNGWSAQAPAGIIDGVVAMFPSIVAQASTRLGIGR